MVAETGWSSTLANVAEDSRENFMVKCASDVGGKQIESSGTDIELSG